MTKTQPAVPPIPADDLAGALGTTVERVLELAGKDVAEDALGRSFVAPEAARRLVPITKLPSISGFRTSPDTIPTAVSERPRDERQ